jgi:pimeloyl-ACP methyl ester carboxylesterase
MGYFFRKRWHRLEFAAIGSLLLGTMSIGAALTVVAENAPNAPLPQFTETPGPHAVGLKVVEQYDHSRAYRVSADDLGRPYRGERARPIQTLVWYPSRKTHAKPMTLSGYFHLIATEARYDKDDAKQEEASERKNRATLLASPMLAVRDAAPGAGKFPVLIYAPGMGDDPWDNAPLCEYLASHGYVVIASASMATLGRYGDGGVTFGNAESRDVLFLLSYAQTLPDTDMSEVAVAGYSYGSIAGLFAAARDRRIKAIVALDGSMRYPGFLPQIKEAGDVHPRRMTIPLIFFVGKQGPDPAGDLKGDQGPDNLLYSWKHGDVYAAWMLQMTHGRFASIYHLPNPRPATADAEEVQIVAGLAWLARYTRAFLDGYLKHDPSELAFLRKRPEENGMPASVLTWSFRLAQGIPPSFDNYREEIGKQGFDHASDIYAAMHMEDPDFKLDEGALIPWVYRLMDTNHLMEALGLTKAYQQMYPKSPEAYYLSGLAYEKSGQKQLAIESYKKALESGMDSGPTDKAEAKLKALESGAAPAK